MSFLFLVHLVRVSGCLVVLGWLAGSAWAQTPPARIEWPVMNTMAAVETSADRAADLPALRDLAQPAWADIENRFSVFRPDSELNRVNNASGSGAWMEISPDVARVLQTALRLSRDSGGVFDPTIGPLMTAWGFRGGQMQHAPRAEELAAARARVGWTHIVWEGSSSNRIRLALPGMRLDLGGIAKGYAVDVAYDRILAAGYTNFLVDLGGNIRAHGESTTRRGGWMAGVCDPFGNAPYVGALLLTNGESLATSGNYERFVKLDGHHYAHIMDPRTGRPVEGMASVTILAPSGLQCDGVSATLYILGPEASQNVLALRPGCEALWIPDAQPLRMIATPGFAKRFTPLPEYQQALTVLPEQKKERENPAP